MITISEVLTELKKVKKTGTGWIALCPAHEDRNPSLSISAGNNEKVLLKCHAGCGFEDIMAAIDPLTAYNGRPYMGGTFAKATIGSNGSNGSAKISNGSSWPTTEIVDRFPHYDEFGEEVYQKVRYAPEPGSTEKQWRFIHFDVDGRMIKGRGGPPVPFNLPGLRTNTTSIVVACEGHSDASSAIKLGLCATDLKDWNTIDAKYLEYLKDKEIIVVPDHDTPGYGFAAGFSEIVKPIAKSLKWFDPHDDEDLPKNHGKDFSDWVLDCEFDGWDADRIKGHIFTHCDGADDWTPEELPPIVSPEEEEFEKPIEIKQFPQPAPECLHGVAGEFIETVMEHTEAHMMALLVQFLVYFGNIVGRSPHIRAGSVRQHTNLYGVIVGLTGSGRKGTSYAMVRHAFEGIDTEHEANCIKSGLSSGEGLIHAVRDPIYTNKPSKNSVILERVVSDAGVDDKRLLCVETEFAQPMSTQGRDGGILSEILRLLWECNGTVGTLTKNSPTKTTNPHYSMIGHITNEEIVERLTEVSISNGWANRILWVCVQRSPTLLPFGGDVPFTKLQTLQSHIREAVEFARTVGEMRMDQGARDRWIKTYARLETPRYFGVLGKLVGRASPYTLRLACIYALLDRKREISREHLVAAEAVWQYCEDSAKFIFGDRTGHKHADALIEGLRSRPQGMTRSEIRDLFNRNISAADLKHVLKFLAENRLAHFLKIRTDGAKKPSEIWFAGSNSNEN